MYKRFTLEELKTVQNSFINNFYSIAKKEYCQMPSDLFKKIFREGNDIYYFNRWEPLFRFSKMENNDVVLMDEREKVQVILDEQAKKDFQSMIKHFLIKKEKVHGQKSIEHILLDAFQEWFHTDILGKKYLVYDIETTGNLDDLKHMKFILAYSMEANEQHKMTYEYIDEEGLEAFVQKMLDWDGYIVGFNNIWFDNPVCIYNTWRSDEDLQRLNEKSIDLYVLIHSLTGKRMGLNKVSEALVAVSKTLASGLEGEKLYKEFLETGDTELMETFKQYCKNDVRMTALVFLYLMHYQKVFIEWEEITFDLEDIINKSNHEIKEIATNNVEQRIFG